MGYAQRVVFIILINHRNDKYRPQNDKTEEKNAYAE